VAAAAAVAEAAARKPGLGFPVLYRARIRSRGQCTRTGGPASCSHDPVSPIPSSLVTCESWTWRCAHRGGCRTCVCSTSEATSPGGARTRYVVSPYGFSGHRASCNFCRRDT
jgi:hypothetical protein